jgi:xylulokinase
VGDILAIDVGTTTFKAGVFDPDLRLKAEANRIYAIRLFDRVKAEINPDIWWRTLRECCSELRASLADVRVISLSVTTPGLTAMDASGNAIRPAILFLDGRSHTQAKDIRTRLGDDYFLEKACNLPVSGGSSLSSLLWLRDEEPDVWNAAAMFGHCNTYMVRRLAGEWAIDPSSLHSCNRTTPPALSARASPANWDSQPTR